MPQAVIQKLNEILSGSVTVTRASKDLGVSRQTLYKWLRKYRRESNVVVVRTLVKKTYGETARVLSEEEFFAIGNSLGGKYGYDTSRTQENALRIVSKDTTSDIARILKKKSQADKNEGMVGAYVLENIVNTAESNDYQTTNSFVDQQVSNHVPVRMSNNSSYLTGGSVAHILAKKAKESQNRSSILAEVLPKAAVSAEKAALNENITIKISEVVTPEAITLPTKVTLSTLSKSAIVSSRDAFQNTALQVTNTFGKITKKGSELVLSPFVTKHLARVVSILLLTVVTAGSLYGMLRADVSTSGVQKLRASNNASLTSTYMPAFEEVAKGLDSGNPIHNIEKLRFSMFASTTYSMQGTLASIASSLEKTQRLAQLDFIPLATYKLALGGYAASAQQNLVTKTGSQSSVPFLDRLSLSLYCAITRNVQSDRCNYEKIAQGETVLAQPIVQTTPVQPVTPQIVASVVPTRAPVVTSAITSNKPAVTYVTNYITSYVPVAGPRGRDGRDGIDGQNGTEGRIINNVSFPSGLGTFFTPSVSSSPIANIGISTISYLKDTTVDTATLNSPTSRNAIFNGLTLFNNDSTFLGTVNMSNVSATSSAFVSSTITNLVATNSTTTNAYITDLFAASATSTNSYITHLIAASSTITDALLTNSTTTDAYIARLVAASSTLTDILVTNATTTNAYVTNLRAASSTLTDVVMTNATTTRSYITNLAAQNSTTTNAYITALLTDTATTTDSYISRLVAASSTLADALVTRSTSTDAYIARLVAASSTLTDVLATNITTTNFTGTNATTTNLFASEATLTNATSTSLFATLLNGITGFFTNLTATNATTTNLVATNATSTNFFSNLLTAVTGLFTDLTTTNLVATNATSTNASITNLATANAIATNATITYLVATSATSTDSYISRLVAASSTFSDALLTRSTSTDAYIARLVAASSTLTDVLATNITTTNFTGTNATTTNLFSTNAYFTNGTSTNWFTQNFAVGNSTNTGNQTIDGTLSVNGTTTLGSNTTIQGSVTLGTSTSNFITVNGLFNSDLVPSQNKIYNLGSPSFYWRDVYADTISVNTLSAGTSNVGGSNSEDFTLNTDNATSDEEDMSLIFFRGLVTPNSVIRWNSIAKRMESNMSWKFQNETPVSGTTTIVVQAGAGQGSTNLLDIKNFAGTSTTVINSQGHIGIGSSTPTHSLVVAGTTTVRDLIPEATLTYALGTASNRFKSAWVETLNIGSSTWSLNQGDNGRLSIFNQPGGVGDERFTITSDGKIGIGTSSPTDAFSVSGNTSLATTTITSLTLTSATSTNLGATNLTSTNATFTNATSTNFVATSATSTNFFATLLNGITGFFTNLTATNATTTNLVATNATSTNFFTTLLNATTAAFTTLSTTGTTTLATAGGNVGIGISNPTAKLDVNGIGKFGITSGNRVAIGGGSDGYSGMYSNITTSQHGDFVVGSNVTINNNRQLVTTNTHIAMTGGAVVIGGNGYTNGANSINFFAQAPGSATEGTTIEPTAARMVIANNGNVGIGTSTPTYPLTVVGNAQITGSEIRLAETVNFYASNTPRLGWGAGGTRGISYINLFPDNVTSSTTVEIAAGSSANTLKIGAGVNVRGGMIDFVGGSAATDAGALIFRSGVSFNAADTQETARMTAAGNFGIGTTTPGSMLTVAGDINITNGSAIKTNGDNFIRGTGTSESVYFGSAGGSSPSGGSNFAAGYRALAGGNTGNYNTAIGIYALGANTTGEFNIALGSNALVYNLTGSQNIGIGSDSGMFLADGTTPNNASSDSLFIGRGTRSGAATSTNEIVIGKNAIGQGSNTIVLGGSAITKTILAGNVGIGTTTVGSKLTVAGDVHIINNSTVNGATALYAQKTGVSAGTMYGLYATADGAGTTNVAGYFDARSATNNYGLLVNSGKVGIGTLTPLSPMDVAGGVAVGTYAGTNAAPTNGLIVSGNVGVGTAAPTTIGSGVGVIDVRGSNGGGIAFGTTAAPVLHLYSFGSTSYLTTSGTNNLLINETTGGNVGIGTTGPGTKLHVSGTLVPFRVDSSNNLFVIQVKGNGDATNGGYIGSDSGSLIFADTTATEKFRIQATTGNVGIGTTNPTSKLTVSGAGYFGGNLTATGTLGVTGLASFTTLTSTGTTTLATAEGNVGIGTTAPTSKFVVATAATNGAVVSAFRGINTGSGAGTGTSLELGYSDAADSKAKISGFYDGTGMVTTFSNSSTAGAAVSEYMRIDRLGNVGIGTTSPSDKFTVQGTASSSFSFKNTSGYSDTSAGGIQLTGYFNNTFGMYVNNAGNLNVGYNNTGSPIVTINNLGNISNSVAFVNAQSIENGPTYSFVGDTNTGMYNPSADSLGFSTGGTNRLHITSAGNVGIGTTTPVSKLVVVGTSTFGSLGSVDGDIVINAAGGGTEAGAALLWNMKVGGGSGNSYLAQIKPRAYTEAGTFGNVLDFHVGGWNNSQDVGVADMTLSYDGKLGIGTTTPGSRLTIAGLYEQYIDSSTNYRTTQRSAGLVGFLGNGLDYFLTYDTANQKVLVGSGSTLGSKFGVGGNVSIGTNYAGTAAPTNGLIVEGNVGIGTTTPEYKLDVVSTTAGGGFQTSSPGVAAYINSTNSNGNKLGFRDNGVARGYLGADSTNSFSISNSAGTPQVVVNNSTGNVGIGPSTPTQRLHISGGNLLVASSTSGGTEVQISNATNDENASVAVRFLAGSGNDMIGSTASLYTALSQISNSLFMRTGGSKSINLVVSDSNPIKLFTNNTERMRVDGDGNVGIGTSAPSNRLTVQGGTNTFPVTSGSDGSDTFLRVTNSVGGPTGGALDFGQHGVNGSWIQSRNAGNYSTNYSLLLNPNGGNVGIGTTNPTGGKLHLVAGTNQTYGTFDAPSAGFAYHGYRAGDVTYGYIGQGSGVALGAAATDFGAQAINNYVIATGGSTERLRVTSTGNVGIGTTNPTSKLTVSGDGYFGGNLTATGTLTILGTGISSFGGSVGIGTTTPGAVNEKLHITTGAQGQTALVISGSSLDNNWGGGIKLTSANGASTNASLLVSTNGFDISNSLSSIRFGTSGEIRAVITTAGNVGVGTTTPSTALEVGSSGKIRASAGVTSQSVNLYTDSGSQSYLEAETGSYGLDIKTLYSGGSKIRFFTNGNNERMQISSSGNVGIGTTNPTSKLTVSGDGYFGGNLTATGTLSITGTATSSISGPMTIEGLTVGRGGGAVITNTALGLGALISNSGPYDTAIGYNALYNNTSGDENVAVGYYALRANTTTHKNTAVGSQALTNNTGFGNTSLGYFSLGQNTSTNINTAIGYRAGYNASTPLTNNSNSVFIGADANSSVDSLTNVIAIGYQAQATQSNQVVLGNSSITQTLLRGNVGIGTESPSAKLTVEATSAGVYVADSERTLLLRSIDSVTADTGPQIGFSGSSGGTTSPWTYGAVAGRKEGATTYAGYLQFSTTPSDSVTQERMRITSAGNVGIGTTTPQAKFDILNGSNQAIFIADSNSTPSVNPYQFKVAGLTKVVIDPSGNVGIGTTTPLGKLTVASTGGVNSGLTIDNNSTSNYATIDFSQASALASQIVSTGSGYSANAFGSNELAVIEERSAGALHLAAIGESGIVKFTTGGNSTSNERMRITSTGNVGIGTTTPTYKLEVLGSNAQILSLQAPTVSGLGYQQITNGTVTGLIGVSNNTGTGGMWFPNGLTNAFSIGSFSAHPFQIATNGAARMTVDATGNVGIGTTTPEIKLALENKIGFNSDSTSGSILFGTLNGGLGNTGTYIKGVQTGIWGSRMDFYARDAGGSETKNVMSVSGEGSGSVGIGTTTPGAKLQISADEDAIPTGMGNHGQVRISGSTDPNKRLLIGFDTTDNFGWMQATHSGVGYKNLVWNPDGGNVGIGTTTPQMKLHINSATANDHVYVSGIAPSLTLGDNSTFASKTNSATFALATTAGNWLNTSDVGDVVLAAKTNVLFGTGLNPGVTNGTEFMRITTAGNVGIGTTSPATKLDIYGGDIRLSGGTNSRLFISAVNASSPQLNFGNDAGTKHYSVYETLGGSGGQGHFTIYDDAASTIRMVIASSTGNVGIGATAPGASRLYIKGGALDDGAGVTYGLGISAGMAAGRHTSNSVNGSASIGSYFNDSSIELAAGQAGGAGLVVTGTGAATNPSTVQFFTGGAGTERMRISSTGNVGIGTTTPSSPLEITGSGDPAINTAALTVGLAAHLPTTSTRQYGIKVNQLGGRYAPQTGVYVDIPYTNGQYHSGTAYGVHANVIAGSQAYQQATAVYGVMTNTDTNYGTGGAAIRGLADSASVNGGDIIANGQGVYGGHFTAFGKGNSVGVYADAYLSASSIAGAVATPLLVASNGTELMRVTSTGNVGIGTTTPSELLSVAGNILLTTSGTANGVKFTTGGSSRIDDTGYNGIAGGRDLSSTYGSMVVTTGNSYSVLPGYLDFYAGLNSGAPIRFFQSQGAEAMRLDAVGRLGIGTTTPGAKLQISADEDAIPTGMGNHGQVRISGSTDPNKRLLIGFDTTDNFGWMQATHSGVGYKNLVWNPDGGNVGIGTTTPNSPASFTKYVQLYDATSASFGVDAGGKRAEFGMSSVGAWLSTADALPFRFSTSNTERMRIDSDGNIGIGTTTTTGVKLNVVGTGQFTTFGPTVEQLVLVDSNTAKKWSFQNDGNGMYVNETGVANRVYFRNGGNVGIGDASPGAKLAVRGDVVIGFASDQTGITNGLSVNGQVAIGAASLSGKLGVVGSIYSNATETDTVFNGSVGTNNANFIGSQGYWALRTAVNKAFNVDVYNAGSPLAALTVLQSGNVGIGTTTPGSLLTLGTTTGNGDWSSGVPQLSFGSTGIQMGFEAASGGSALMVKAGTAAGMVLRSNKVDLTSVGTFRWTNSSTNPLTTLDLGIGRNASGVLEINDGNPGVLRDLMARNVTATGTLTVSGTGTSTMTGGLSVAGGAFTVDGTTGVTSIANAEFGNFSFDLDAGQVSWVDLPISATTATGTVMSYTSQLGGNPMLTVYGEHDGTGNIQNPRFGFGTTTPTSYAQIVASGTAPLFTVGTSTNQSIFNILANGNVGIGTTTPDTKLYVKADNNYLEGSVTIEAPVYPSLFLKSAQPDALNRNWGIFGDYEGYGSFVIRNSNASGGNPGSAGQSRFVIDRDGNIGIGTTTADTKFQVLGRSSVVADSAALGNSQIEIRGSTNPASHLYLGYDTSSNYGYLQGTTDAVAYRDFVLNPNGGNIGIGTTTPAGKLEVEQSGTASVDGMVRFFKPALSSGNYQTILIGRAAGSNESAGLGYIYDSGGSSKLILSHYGDSGVAGVGLTVLKGGNVGIGTTTPDTSLTIAKGNSGNVQNLLSLKNTGTSANGTGAAILFSSLRNDGLDQWTGKIESKFQDTTALTEDSSMHFYSFNNGSWADSLTIKSGNVGIGTSTPDSKLDIWNSTGTSNVDIFRIGTDVGSTNNIKFRIDSDGDIFTDGSTTIGAGADVAESYLATEAVDPGTVVAFASATTAWSSVHGSDTASADATDVYDIAGVRKAQDEYEAIGIISTRPGLHLGADVVNGVPVALSGRVPVKVTTENGTVQKGDYLTVSKTMPGYAMKLTGEGRAIARAISDYTPHNGKVIAYIETGFQRLDTNGKYASTTGMLTTGNVDLNANGVAIYNIKSLASANGTWSISEDGKIIARMLCLEDVCIDKEQLRNIMNASGQSSTASGSTGGEVAGTSTQAGAGETTPQETSTSTPEGGAITEEEESTPTETVTATEEPAAVPEAEPVVSSPAPEPESEQAPVAESTPAEEPAA